MEHLITRRSQPRSRPVQHMDDSGSLDAEHRFSRRADREIVEPVAVEVAVCECLSELIVVF